MTHRQFEAWAEWESESMNRPGRTEYYLAQACCEIRRVMSTNPSGININDFLLVFRDKREIPEEEKKVLGLGSKLTWGKRMTMPITVVSKEDATWVYPPDYKGPIYGRGDRSSADPSPGG